MKINKTSICITVKDRSKFPTENDQYLHLFPHCVESIAKSIRTQDSIELIISDWHSTDWPLEEWIDEKLNGIPFKIIKAEGEFHRGTGRNIAADHASGSYLFFLDADMLISRPILEHGFKCAEQNQAYFPSCFYFTDHQHNQGFWCIGKGVCMVTKEMYQQAGKWPCPPHYRRHHDEDWAFFEAIQRIGIETKVNREEGFFHQYHPGRSVDLILRQKQNIVSSKSNIEYTSNA